jgi:hypothetical protein
MKKIKVFVIVLLLVKTSTSFGWGFFAHKLINKMAIYTLPPEMIVFFRHHINYISENAINPDKRRSVLAEEGSRHFIDLDVYGDSAAYKLPRYWKDAVVQYSEDSLKKHGIAPWHVYRIKGELTEAFRQHNVDRILRLSADLGHYVSDANVPLHTTRNYNGQLTGQYGIHGFWESRLPELYSNQYDFFVGKARYLEKPQIAIWNAVMTAHFAVDSVLLFERALSQKFPQDKKYSHEERGNATMKVYSQEYSKLYHHMLGGQVEARMRASIKMVGDFWYTCWVDAGQPDLKKLLKNSNQIPEVKREEKLQVDEENTGSCH